MARRLLEAADTVAAVRAPDEDPAAGSGLWRQIVDAGWPAIAIPETYGGAGASFAELGVVLVELGRVLAPGPYLGTFVLGAAGLLFGATDDQREQ